MTSPHYWAASKHQVKEKSLSHIAKSGSLHFVKYTIKLASFTLYPLTFISINAFLVFTIYYLACILSGTR